MNIVWKPQSGSQELFISCPVEEVLFSGTRGGCGKTDALLMSYLQYVGRGYGEAWRGIIFRITYLQLKDIIAKSIKWFLKIFPDAKFNRALHTWTFPWGEQLVFSNLMSPIDLEKYQGHEYPFIGFEELTNWPTSDCYEGMKICCRSSVPNMPRMYRSTCNPLGRGHSWVKSYFVDVAPHGKVYTDELGNKRVWISGSVLENKVLLAADPTYVQKLQAIKDPNKRAAWLDGRWDIVAGGVLSDVWDSEVHVIKPFKIPYSWYVDRSFDWGSSKPFAVLFWAESSGEAVEIDGNYVKYPKGTVFLIHEYYGCQPDKPDVGVRLQPKKIAENILEIQNGYLSRITSGQYVNPGCADPSIYDGSRGTSIADQMKSWTAGGKVIDGVTWIPADSRPGSRVSNLLQLRQMLENSLEHPMESPGLFVFDTCRNFIRTVPVLPIDPKKPDDVDTASEDHIYDATRYRISSSRTMVYFSSLLG